jgi:hypothetical protein
MALCQGLSAGHAQLLAFPAAKPSLLRRSCLRTPAGSLGLKSAHLLGVRKNFSVKTARGMHNLIFFWLCFFFAIMMQFSSEHI